MTTTLSYGTDYYNDMDNATDWGAEHLVQMGAGDASISSDGDVLTMTGVTDDVAQQEYFYHTLDMTNFYSNYVSIRFKTDHASAGMAAYFLITYSDADTQAINLGYSQDWKVTTTALDHTDKLVDSISIYCYEEAAANANGTAYVYYDWVMFHYGTFTFPHVDTVQVSSPNKIAQLQIPGRKGDILQNLGHASAEITVSIKIKEGETWRSDVAYPEFDYLLTAMSTDTWSYFMNTRPLIRCQVMFKGITYGSTDDKGKMTLNLHFLVYKLGAYSLFSDYSWIWGKA